MNQIQLDNGLNTGSGKALGGVGDAAKVATVNPTTGVPADSGSHAYGYTNGLLTTDTWTTSTGTFQKTYGYNASGQLTSESDWVKQ